MARPNTTNIDRRMTLSLQFRLSNRELDRGYAHVRQQVERVCMNFRKGRNEYLQEML